MSGPNFKTRGPGMGRVEFAPTMRQKYGVYAPGHRTTTGVRGVQICRCDTRHAAEKALLAWYVVHAVELLASLGSAAERCAS